MPELPEVETIKLGLQKKIIGLKIKKIQILSAKSFIGDPKLVENKKVINVFRRAKMLGVELTGNSEQVTGKKNYNLVLLFHLKMSGQIIFIPKGNPSTTDHKRFIGGHPTFDMAGKMPNSHTRVIFEFSDPLRPRSEASGSSLYFNDQRKFGWVKVVDSDQLTMDSLFEKLGPEPLEKDFSWQILKENLLKHKKTPIKVSLMDQAVVSGVGNIYANEACFSAGLDPRVRVRELSDLQIKKLHAGIIKSLKEGIKYGGASRAHFVDSDGYKGYFLDYVFVYGRDKHPCKVCKLKIEKITLGGRGTFFCPACQR